jgi:hypothetical protein
MQDYIFTYLTQKKGLWKTFSFGSQTHVSSNKHVVYCTSKLCVTNVGEVRYENDISLFNLVINQLDAQNLLYNKFISCLCMFRAHVLIVRRSKLYYAASGIITPIGGRPVHRIPEAV